MVANKGPEKAVLNQVPWDHWLYVPSEGKHLFLILGKIPVA